MLHPPTRADSPTRTTRSVDRQDQTSEECYMSHSQHPTRDTPSNRAPLSRTQHGAVRAQALARAPPANPTHSPSARNPTHSPALHISCALFMCTDWVLSRNYMYSRSLRSEFRPPRLSYPGFQACPGVPPARPRIVCHGLHAAASLEIRRELARRIGLDLLHKRNCVGLSLAPVSQLHC